MPEIIDPVFAKTSQNARFLLSENERFVLVFVKTGSINSGTGISDLDEKVLPLYWQGPPDQLQSGLTIMFHPLHTFPYEKTFTYLDRNFTWVRVFWKIELL
jgi:hypothetical protein